ncbi:AraC family transcriptional regulator [Nocardia cyriacigeorgica]|uniref:helix-turn-helix domain-containing protein n=1 Tax=Nocardia cyriacigeorgica TaxID=135487 RepID=UPI0013BE057D|nr:helix-turn-helix domain-containing protein [Nocardia cyriacigeorgica]NEW52338.1 AraC family transcriptional regulator [Nocardia cyriacigeorgica]
MPDRGDRAPVASALADRKGILHPDEQARHRTLVRLPVGPDLADVIDWYWSVRWDLRGQPPYSAQVLPFPCVNVTFERSESKTGGFVNGVCTTKFVRELSGVGETFGIRFRAGGFGAFTGLDVGEFRDRAVALAEVLPEADRLTQAVLAESSDAGRRAVVESFFGHGVSAPDPNYALVLRIVDAMAADEELTRVDQVTERFAVSTRTLQRLFRRYIGAGPKWVLRRYRLQDAADLLAHGRIEDLAALSAELGYYDQAHFTREFTAEIGMAPLEYAKQSIRSRNEVTAKLLPGAERIPEQFR